MEMERLVLEIAAAMIECGETLSAEDRARVRLAQLRLKEVA
jgi:hypothetical protein